MARIISSWRLVFRPGGSQVVLLDYGDLIGEELKPDQDRPADVVPLTDTAAPFIRPTGNRTHTLGARVYQKYASNVEMHKALWDTQITLDAQPKAELRILSNLYTGYHKLAVAWIAKHTVQPSVEPTGAYLIHDYTITGTGLSWVP